MTVDDQRRDEGEPARGAGSAPGDAGEAVRGEAGRTEAPQEDGLPPPDEEAGTELHYQQLMLSGLFVIGLVLVLRVAKEVIMPIVLALLLSILLAPIVRVLNRMRLPEGIAAGLVLLVLLGAVGFGAYSLTEPAAEWMERLPQTIRRVEWKLRPFREPIERVSEATQQVEDLAEGNDGDDAPTVEVRGARLGDIVVSRTRGFLVAAVIVIILLYFLLASGDLFLHKLVRVQPRLRDKKRAVEIVRLIKRDMSTYLFTISVINGGLGVAVGIAMYLLGMPNALLWGVMAAALNFIPYLGAIVGVTVIALVAMVTFDDTQRILLTPTAYFLLTAAEGYLVTPMILGARLTLNPVVIFIGLIFWSWLWGIPGALLSVPILAMVKIVCDRVDPLKPVGEFLGR